MCMCAVTHVVCVSVCCDTVLGHRCSRNRPPSGPKPVAKSYPANYVPTAVYKVSPLYPNGRTLRDYQVEGLNWLVRSVLAALACDVAALAVLAVLVSC